MTTFDRLMEPVLPILQKIEQERVPHFNETYSWPLFVRVLVYHFTMGYQSMRELVTGLRHADAALALPALPRSTVSQMFTRFDSELLHRALVRLLRRSREEVPPPAVPIWRGRRCDESLRPG